MHSGRQPCARFLSFIHSLTHSLTHSLAVYSYTDLFVVQRAYCNVVGLFSVSEMYEWDLCESYTEYI